MNRINEALKNIVNKNLDEMRNNFNASISQKAVQRLDEKKQEIAQNYFGQKKKK